VLDQNDAVNYMSLGQSYLMKGQNDKAIEVFKKVRDMDTTEPNKEFAKKILRQIEDTAKQEAKAAFERGLKNVENMDLDQAIKDFSEAIRLNPNVSNFYNLRGCAYMKKGHNDQAIIDFNEAIRLDPNDADTYLFRGTAYAYGMSGQKDKAIRDFEKVLNLNPDEPTKEIAEKMLRQMRGY